jgi:hypothetical protein
MFLFYIVDACIVKLIVTKPPVSLPIKVNIAVLSPSAADGWRLGLIPNDSPTTDTLLFVCISPINCGTVAVFDTGVLIAKLKNSPSDNIAVYPAVAFNEPKLVPVDPPAVVLGCIISTWPVAVEYTYDEFVT